MDKDDKQGGGIYTFVAWADAHRKELLIGLGVLVLAGVVAGLYIWHKAATETAANAAYCALKLPAPGEPATEAEASQFGQVADNYPETSAGARAMLEAGSMFFEAGDYERARVMFERLLGEHPDFPMADQAAIGVATCLEAQGKTAEAVAHYKDILQHAPGPTFAQARSSLGRIYTQENKPEDAVQQYIELLQMRQNDSWTMEAQAQLQGLLEKYPEIRQKLAEQAPRTPAPASAPATAPAPTLQTGKP